MRILIIAKYPPIEGGVSADAYWTAQALSSYGHNVTVLTNSFEVEATCRMELDADDHKLLTGYWESDKINLHCTENDKKHIFIPQSNPMVSKLVGLGLKICSEWRPDFIWASYCEPYGVAALLLSKLTGVPYVFKHAGSDIGRLMPTRQLSQLYREVFLGALVVLTRTAHLGRFTKMGVKAEKLWPSPIVRLPYSVFSACRVKNPTAQLVVGVYGKAGPTKGSLGLISAVNILRKAGVNLKVRALWGGRGLMDCREAVKSLGMENVFEILPFTAHWKIPRFIATCDLICFLEEGFPIPFHVPLSPLEVIACNTRLAVTREIAEKPFYKGILEEGRGCYIVGGQSGVDDVASVIKKASDSVLQAPIQNNGFNLLQFDNREKEHLKQLVEQISTLI